MMRIGFDEGSGASPAHTMVLHGRAKFSLLARSRSWTSRNEAAARFSFSRKHVEQQHQPGFVFSGV
jgi:hypothetical protein